MLLDGRKKRSMANPSIAIFDYSMDGDKHIFSYKDGSYLDNIEGTMSEIAYLIFEKCIIKRNEPMINGVIRSWPPFEVETTVLGQLIIKTDLLCAILPEPEQAFWDELNRYFKREVDRHLNLKAFW